MGRLNNKNYDNQRSQINNLLTQLSPANLLIDLLRNLQKNDAAALWRLSDILNPNKEQDTFSDKDLQIIHKCFINILELLLELSHDVINLNSSDRELIKKIIDNPASINEEDKLAISNMINSITALSSYHPATPVRVLLWISAARQNGLQDTSLFKDVSAIIRDRTSDANDLLQQLRDVFNQNNGSSLSLPADSVVSSSKENAISKLVQDRFNKMIKDVVAKMNLNEALRLQNAPYQPQLIVAPEEGYSSAVLPNTRIRLCGVVEDRVVAVPCTEIKADPNIVSDSMKKAIATMVAEIKSTQKQALHKTCIGQSGYQQIHAQGSTFNGAFINRKDDKVFVCGANLGDSLTYHIKKRGYGWRSETLTQLHRPHELRERGRIIESNKMPPRNEEAGPSSQQVVMSNERIVDDFNDSLKVSRSFGDLGYEEMGLSYEPDIFSWQFDVNDNNHPGYLLFVTDGVHDVLPGNQLLDSLIARSGNNLLENLPDKIISEIKTKAKKKGMKEIDDASLVLVDLSTAQGFFGAYDGHGGKYVAIRAAKQLPKIFLDELKHKHGCDIHVKVTNEKKSVAEVPAQKSYSSQAVRQDADVLGQFPIQQHAWRQQWSEIQNSALPNGDKTKAKQELCNQMKATMLNLSNFVTGEVDKAIRSLNQKSGNQNITLKEMQANTDVIVGLREMKSNYQQFSQHVQQQLKPTLTTEELSEELDSLHDTARLTCRISDQERDEQSKKRDLIDYRDKYFTTPAKNKDNAPLLQPKRKNNAPLIQAEKDEVKKDRRKLMWCIFQAACLATGVVAAGLLIGPGAAAIVAVAGIAAHAIVCHTLFKVKPPTPVDTIKDASLLITAMRPPALAH